MAKFYMIVLMCTFIVMMIYCVRTVIIMAKDHVLWVLAGLLVGQVGPFVQFVYYLSFKDNLDDREKSVLVTYFYISIGYACVLIFGYLNADMFS